MVEREERERAEQSTGLLTLRPPGEDELLERGDGGVGVVLAGPDVGAVEQPELHLDRLLPAGHLHGRIAGAFHPHQPLLLQDPNRQQERPPGQGRESAQEFRGWRKGLPEIRAGRASTDADPTEDPIFCARI